MRALIIVIFCSLALQPAISAEENIDFKKRLEEELKQSNATASATFASACINVTRDVREKRIRIFAVSPKAKTGVFKKNGFKVEVVYHEELADLDPKVAGAYYQHNNSLVLQFAGFQFASGRKDMALYLVHKVLEAEPDREWSSPKQSPTPLKTILAGLEANDGSAQQFLEDGKLSWPWHVETYAP